MSKNKKIFYWKWGVGAMQIMYMLQQMDHNIDLALQKPSHQRTSAEGLYLTELYLNRQEIVAQISEHEALPHTRQTIFDTWMLRLYRWSQSIPKDMPLKLTDQDL